MLSNLFIHRIVVVRWASSGTNSLGEEVQSSSTVVPASGIPARIETVNSKTEYRDSNERGLDETLIYTPKEYLLQLQDDIYWNGEYIGLIKGIFPALKGTTTQIDHYEYTLESP